MEITLKNRIFAMILAVIMLLSIMPISAFAQAIDNSSSSQDANASTNSPNVIDDEDVLTFPVTFRDVATSEELESALNDGIDAICITASFVIDRTFYVTSDTIIYSKGDATLTRSPDFAGDVFVVGQDSSGNLCSEKVILSLGAYEAEEGGSLTINGNSENMTVDVLGTVVFVCPSAQADLYEGLTVTNCKKVGNERALDAKHELSNTKYIGGAVAILAKGSYMNIYGGTYSYNSVNTTGNSVYGGAFYNFATMNVYGGLFENNSAVRAGAFYNYRTLSIYNAEIRNNTSSTAGGAIYLPASTGAKLYLGGNNEITNSSVVFSGNIAGSNGGAILSSGRVTVENTFFEGNSATNGGAIFGTGSYNALNITNSTFKSNSCTEDGGAISCVSHNTLDIENDLTISNTTFEDNSADNGGVIALFGSSVALVSDSLFKNNSANTFGGAISVTTATITVDNVEFDGNSAVSAGVLYFSENSTITMNKIDAHNNDVVNYGGVLYGTASNVNVYNSSFKDNTGKAGSAIYLSTNAVSNIYGSNFTKNICDESNTGNAGAIFVYTGAVNTVIHSCTFTQNSSSGLGGGIFVSGKSNLTLYNITAIENNASKGGFMYETTSGTIVTISGLTVSGNTATVGGPIIWGNTANAKLFVNKANHVDLDVEGALPSDYWSSAIANKLTVSESDAIIPDYTDYSGEIVTDIWSAVIVTNLEELEKALLAKEPLIKIASDIEINKTIYIDYSTTIFSTSMCKISRAEGFDGDLFIVQSNDSTEEAVTLTFGSLVSATKNLLVIDGCNGGATIVSKQGSQINIYDNVTLTSNTSTIIIEDGGVVNIYGGIFTSSSCSTDEGDGKGTVVNNGELNIFGGLFTQNSADLGGVIYNVGTLTISNGTFENNTALNGGVIYNIGTLVLSGGSFISNTAENGGAIYLADGVAQEFVASFESCSATNGGAIYVSSNQNLNVTISASFTSNNATMGGAIYVDNNELDIINATFSSNTAKNDGGAVYITNGTISVADSSFDSCSAQNGGAIALVLSKATISSTSASLNKAKANGGFINSNDSELTISNNEFNSNDGVLGGGIYATDSSVSVSNDKFIKNSAVEGGAIYIEASSINLDNPEFSNNTADYNGGALAIYSSLAYMVNATFDINKASNDGGAIFSDNATLTVYEGSFNKNEANMNGGALAIDEESQAKIYTSTFTSNLSKKNGGAVYTSAIGTDVVIQLCQFTSNKSLSFGGGLYACDKSNVKLYNNTATQNNAVRGGFIYIADSNTEITLIDITVNKNTATAGPIVYGNSNNATLYVNKSLYSDTANTSLNDSYYHSAFYGLLTVKYIYDDAPEFIEEGNEPVGDLTNSTEVSNAQELENALKAKKKVIKVVADFEIDRTFYITYDVTIFSSAHHVLTRAPEFGGDIFVVGEYEDGTNSVIESNDDKLTLGNPSSKTPNLLVIDGNKSNMTVDVVGTVIFICSGATVNLYENLSVINCHKTGNERTLMEKYIFSRPNRIGGPVAILYMGALNVYGGTYSNNSVNEEDNSSEETRNSTLGGLFYNKSNIRIYNGSFENNEGARGGIVYNYGVIKVYGGSFIGNRATVSGGVYYAPNSASVSLNIGYNSTTPVLFKDNVAQTHGGVICSSVLNGLVIYGNTTFDGNKANTGSGGAIYTSSMVTAKNTVFLNNYAKSYGGAIYASKGSATYDTRIVNFENCSFIGNESASGGAMALYAGDDEYIEGAIATVYDSQFTSNKASSGGAIYLNRKSSLSVYNSTFTENSSTSEGGALYITSESKVNINDSEISANTAEAHGGAISVRSSTLKINSTRIENNTCSKNGGAIYIAYVSNVERNASVSLTGSILKSNTSKSSGGAIYATRRAIEGDTQVLTAKSTDFAQNTAKNDGGAILLTAGVNVFMSNVTFISNKTTNTSEGTGGALTVFSSTLELDGAVFTKNYSGHTGGALYVGTNSKAILNNIVASRNSSRTHGGFAYNSFGDITVYNSSFSANSGSMGGAFYLYEGATAKFYTTEFKNNLTTSDNGGALFVYTFGTEVTVNGCSFTGNNAKGFGGAVYVSGESILNLYNNTMTNNSAESGGALYITKASTVVTIVGLTVSGNTATNGPIILGNTKNADLYLDVSKYKDLDFDGEMDDAYWKEAIKNALTVIHVTQSIPSVAKYNSKLEAIKTNTQKAPVSVNDVFDLALNSSDGYIDATYDKFPVLDKSSNFMSKGETIFENINGETVTVDTYVYPNYGKADNMTVGEALMIYQAMLYKKANPSEEVYIDISSYRFSVQTAININRDSRYFGYARCLPHSNYDEFGFVRVSYLLVSAAKMGIHVNVIAHTDAYPIVYSPTVPTKFYDYFDSFIDQPCDPDYVKDAVIGDYLEFHQSAWTISTGGKGGTDMMHTKLCAVSHYLDMNGVVHKNAVWTSSSNLDGIKTEGYNANWKQQTATIVSDHEPIYRVSVNYLRLMGKYTDKQEGIIEFQNVVNFESTKQIDLIYAGDEDKIPKNEQIVYVGSENDNVFEMYFAPFAGDILSWDEVHNPYCKYFRELYESEDYILFTWNAAEYSGGFPLGQQIEQILIDAFHKNKNPNNQIYANMESFDATTFDDLVVGKDIGFKSINKWEKGAIHNKDLQFSYVKNGQRYYVSLLNSLNLHSGSMYYQSNSALVIKETTCSENSVFATIAKYSTTADLITHNFGEEKTKASTETEHGYKYMECSTCGHIEILDTIHYASEWKVEKVATPLANGIRYKECIICDKLLESEETKYSGQSVSPDNNNSGMSFTDSTIIPIDVSKTPLTLEATIQLSKNFVGRGGVIVGSYSSFEDENAINLEIFTNGKVRLFFINKGIRTDVIFSYDIRSNEPVHIAVTVDGKNASLYVDGALKETLICSNTLPNITNQFTIGGDRRTIDVQTFKGKIYSVSLFSDIRTEEEIKQDMDLVSSGADNVIYTTNLNGENEDELDYIKGESTSGSSFNNSITNTLEPLDNAPQTFEAVIMLPTSFNDRAGVIIGNYKDAYTDAISLEVMPGGKLRLFYLENNIRGDYTFSYDIRSNEPIHLALTIDETIATLFVNGEQVEQITLSRAIPKLTDNFVIGGDYRTNNEQYFKGKIYSVSLFNDVRTEEEIKQDCIFVNDNEDGLLKSVVLTKNGNSSFNGQKFDEGSIGIADCILNSTPLTFEAIVHLPKDYANRAGVIVSNNFMYADLISFEVYKNGKLRLYYENNDVVSDIRFETDIRSDKPIHIALSVDGLVASVYINGELVETKTLPRELPVSKQGFHIGGDLRPNNAQYFKGTIYSVSLFDHARNADEIKSDILSVAGKTGLLFTTQYIAPVKVDKDSVHKNTIFEVIREASINSDGLGRIVCQSCGKILSINSIPYMADGIINNNYTNTDSALKDNKYYIIEDVFKSAPKTFEFLLQLSPDQIERGGVIFGNYDNSVTGKLNLEIYTDGNPRIWYKINGTSYSYVFNTDIRSNEPVHLAITIDGLTAKLYLNGEFKESIQLAVEIPYDYTNFYVANDKRINVQSFKGQMFSASVFSDVRTPEEIKNDMIMITSDTDNLLFSKYFVASDVVEAKAPWADKSAIFVGDSITYGAGCEGSTYWELLKESLELKSADGLGVPGSCISSTSNYGDLHDPLINRYDELGEADLIVIFMGTNDYGHDTPLGTIDDTTDVSFYGALNTIVPALKAKYPNATIVFVTPVHRYGYGTNSATGEPHTFDRVPNGAGHTLEDYSTAILEVCKKYSVPTIDLFTLVDLDPSLDEVREYYMPDGLHPNGAGHRYIAEILKHWLLALANDESAN